MLAAVGDPEVGGRELDRILVHHFAEEFKPRYKVRNSLSTKFMK